MPASALLKDWSGLVKEGRAYAYPPREVAEFALSCARKTFQELTQEERKSLAAYAACPECCELYLEIAALVRGKTLVVTDRIGSLDEHPP